MLLFRGVQERRGLTLEEIENATFVDATTNAELQANLKKNPKIAVEGDTYRYKVHIGSLLPNLGFVVLAMR